MWTDAAAALDWHQRSWLGMSRQVCLEVRVCVCARVYASAMHACEILLSKVPNHLN